jgi:hypothetical protein
LNLTLVLTNYRVLVAVFLELAAVAGLTELLVTKGRTAERVATMFVVAEIVALRLDLVIVGHLARDSWPGPRPGKMAQYLARPGPLCAGSGRPGPVSGRAMGHCLGPWPGAGLVRWPD